MDIVLLEVIFRVKARLSKEADENDFQGEGATLTAIMAYGLLCGAFYCINLLSKKGNYFFLKHLMGSWYPPQLTSRVTLATRC